MGEMLFRIKRFYRWESREMRDIYISVLGISFIFAFNDGRETFNLVFWLFNFLKTLLIVGISFFAYDAGMRLAALHQGYRAEYRLWPTGLGLGIIMTLLTKGKFPLLLAGGLFLHHHMILRLGKFRYGINRIAYGTIAAAGPFANLLVMTIALTLSRQLHIMPALFDYVAKINGIMIIYNLLPIPKTNGIHIFFMSRLSYIFIATTLVSYVLLTLAGIYSWIFAFLIGVLCWLLWYWFIEGGKD